MEYVNKTSVGETKKYYKKIDSDLKKYEIPNNFDNFFNKLYKNMLYSVGVKVRFDFDIINSIIRDFTIYMLEKDKFGVVRYKKYNAKKYPDIPYYKWFLKNLSYFVLKYWRSIKKDFSQSNLDKDVDRKTDDSLLKKNKLFCPILSFDSPESMVFMNEICNFLENYSNENYNNFRMNAYMLYIFKFEGYSNTDLAYLFDINNGTVAVWIKELRNLILNFLQQNNYSAGCKVYMDNLIRM